MPGKRTGNKQDDKNTFKDKSTDTNKNKKKGMKNRKKGVVA